MLLKIYSWSDHKLFDEYLSFFKTDHSVTVRVCCFKPWFKYLLVKVDWCLACFLQLVNENFSGFFFVNSTAIVHIKLLKDLTHYLLHRSLPLAYRLHLLCHLFFETQILLWRVLRLILLGPTQLWCCLPLRMFVFMAKETLVSKSTLSSFMEIHAYQTFIVLCLIFKITQLFCIF